jgi:glycosyltransferase involved in cell wall biosynthesis
VELSIVISTLGNYSGLARVLDRYEGQDVLPGTFEVLVVADAADPEPGAVDEAIGDRPYPVRRLTGHIPGLSANRNTGWPLAQAPLVLFTDNDTLPASQLVSEHLTWHRSYPEEEVAVLGYVRWARELRVTPFMRWLDHGIQFDYPSIEGIEAGWGRFYGANVSVKKRLLERVGGFDEKRLPYLYDDLDFGYRASKIGLRLLYNRRAVVEHLREMDLDFYRSKMPRAAAAERAFVSIHPEIPAHFHRLFSDAAKRPLARGRGRYLLGIVPRWIPWLGPRVWRSADLYYRQALAWHFLAAWADEDPVHSPDRPVVPYLLEHEALKARRGGRAR